MGFMGAGGFACADQINFVRPELRTQGNACGVWREEKKKTKKS